jgi:hypothetical protein
MKKATILALAFLGLIGSKNAVAQDTVSVTFTVNFSTYSDTLLGNNVNVYVNGNIKGKGASASPAFASGETLGWDSKATAILTHVGGDNYRGTFKVVKGDTVLYKFRFKYKGADGEGLDESGFATSQNPAGWDTRGIIASDNMVLPVAYFNRKSGNPTLEQTSPFNAANNHADSVGVLFRVEVGGSIQLGTFDTTKAIQVRGNLAPLTWGDNSVNMTYAGKTGANRFYQAVVYFKKADLLTSNVEGSVQPNKIRYEYFHEGHWDGAVNVTLPTTKDTTLAFKFYRGNRVSSTPILQASVRFEAEMSLLQNLIYTNPKVASRKTSYFDPAIDKVYVRGDFSEGGWGSSAGVNDLLYSSETFAFGRSFLLSRRAGDQLKHKYFIEYGAARRDTTSQHYIAAIAANNDFGYEEPATTGGGDRFYAFTAEETQLVRHAFNDIPRMGTIEADDIAGGSLAVTFRIDMRPATVVEGVPFNPATDSAYIQLESKYTALTQGIVSGGGFFTNRANQPLWEAWRLKPTTTEGIYEATVILKTPTLNDFGYVVTYGKPMSGPMTANGRGFAAGRRYYRFITPTSVKFIEKDPFEGDIYESKWPATALFEEIWAEENLPYSVQPDYIKIASSNEGKGSGRVNGFELMANYPNPFNPSTTINFRTPAAGRVSLEVFNVLGQKVATLMNNEFVAAGSHARTFDAKNLASGMYIYRMTANGFVSQRKMMLVK